MDITKYDFPLIYPYLKKKTLKSLAVNINMLSNAYYYHDINEMRLIDLIKAYPDLEWSFTALASNPNITTNDLLENPQFEWSTTDFGSNPNLTMSDILNNPDLPPSPNGRTRSWDIRYIARNSNFTLQNILDLVQVLYVSKGLAVPEYKTDLSFNKNITLQDVFDNPGNWNFSLFSRYGKITIKDVIDHPEIKWDYKTLTYNPNITIEDIFNNPYLPKNQSMVNWDMGHLISEGKVTLNDILTRPYMKLYYRGISMNPNITIQDIRNHPDLPWNYGQLASYANITMDDMFTVHGFQGYYNRYSRNRNLTIKDLISNPQMQWDFDSVLMNKSIDVDDLQFIRDNEANIKWTGTWHMYIMFYSNPNLTIEYVYNDINNGFTSGVRGLSHSFGYDD